MFSLAVNVSAMASTGDGPTVMGATLIKLYTTTFPDSTWFKSPAIFLSVLLFAPASLGFLPTHFSECFPLILYVILVMQDTFEASACPPENVITSIGSSAGFPIVSESNGTYSTAVMLSKILRRIFSLVFFLPNCSNGLTPRFSVSPSSFSKA